jgi:solute carrier family 25 carnitine/acylcarnitine transporter 20/29
LTRWQAGLVEATSARSMAETFGFKALWRGASPMMSAVPLQNAILMGGYGIGQNYAEAKNDRLVAIFVGGCVGGALQSFLMSPVELVKVSQQCNLQANALATGKDVMREIFTPNSWRGLNATLLRDGVPHGVWFLSYEIMKENLGAKLGEDSVAVPLISGAGAATVAWAVGYPADLIKTRQQAGSKHGILRLAQELVAEANGSIIQGLYRGFGLKLVRTVPGSMIGFSVYEWVKKQLV